MRRLMKPITLTCFAVSILALSSMATNAAIVYQDDFSADPGITGPIWNDNSGDPASYDGANEEVDYDHTAGTTRRFVNHNNGTFSSTEGYFKATISNFTGDTSIRMGFIEDNRANNENYAFTLVGSDGTIEMVVNNSGSPISYNNGAGWSGTLAANSGLATTDGGTTSSPLSFGTAVTSGVSLKGFGFANFGNSTAFPSSSFSIDDVVVSDVAELVTIPEPTTLALLSLAGLGLCFRRR